MLPDHWYVIPEPVLPGVNDNAAEPLPQNELVPATVPAAGVPAQITLPWNVMSLVVSFATSNMYQVPPVAVAP